MNQYEILVSHGTDVEGDQKTTIIIRIQRYANCFWFLASGYVHVFLTYADIALKGANIAFADNSHASFPLSP
jgi:hypothetical protein